jgi:hypothetical protein
MMPETPPVSTDRYAALRAYAATQRQITVDRLQVAITKLESDNRPVSTFTVKEVSGLDYMAYYRNPEALALFRRHSTHLRMEREKKHVSRRRKISKTTERANTQTRSRTAERESLHDVPVQPSDRLLNYKKPRLVALLREALAERDQFQQRYHALLQEHMQCGLTIARLEAQVNEYLAYMEGFRSSLI